MGPDLTHLGRNTVRQSIALHIYGTSNVRIATACSCMNLEKIETVSPDKISHP